MPLERGQIQAVLSHTQMLPLLSPHFQENPKSYAGGQGYVLSAGELAEEIARAWERAQFAVKSQHKDSLRSMHIEAKKHDGTLAKGRLRKELVALEQYFPDPARIDPSRIDAELVHVDSSRSLEGRLFRLLRAYWSMPFSKGYGRRLRFLVIDRYHGSVIGLIGLQSPPADLMCRDAYFGANRSDKLIVANTTMDAYTVGASPTYASLLGGKLVAGFIHSEKIRQAYWRTYGTATTVIESRRLSQPLLAVTTTSAFGRSSIYNRLKFDNQVLAKPLGYTKGFGTVHLEALYPHMVAWLKQHGKHVPAGFGNGPKVRWQNVMRTLGELNIPRAYLNHGLRREVFIFEFARNLARIHRFNEMPEMESFDDDAWSQFWKERWCLPRAASKQDWRDADVRAQMSAAIDQFS